MAISFGIVILLIAAGLGIFYFKFFRGNPPLKENQLRINDSVFTVEIASTSIEQANGLSFRKSLAPAAGMLFIFSQSGIQHFWMKDMNFPLDMIWISDNKVVGFAENVAPEPGAPLWSLKIYDSPDNTNKVLEVNAGTVAKDHIKVGDTVAIGV